jgi:hypothetical protein
VHEDLRYLAPGGHLDERVQVPLVTVNAAVGHQADEMERVFAAGDAVHRCGQGGTLEELSVSNALVDARQVLIDNAAGTHVHVSDLGVTHLAGGQADGLA